MADDDPAIAGAALETPASGEIETPELEIETGTDQQLEGEEGQDETDELDFGFEKYVVPKKLKEVVEALRADATQKTQTVSARQKALDEREAQISQQAEVTEAELDTRAGLRSLAAEIERFKTYDYAAFQQHYRTNPMEATEAWAYKQDLANRQAELDGKLRTYANERTEKAQSDLTKRVQETLAEAPKFIPGFKPEMIGKLVEFAEGMEIDEQTIKKNWSPKFLKLLHLASLGDKAINKPAAKAVTPPAPELKTVTAKSNPGPTQLRDDISGEEWLKRRNAQLQKRRA